MNKKILLSIGVILVILIIGFFWMSSRNRSVSPSGKANYTDGDLQITIEYSRPSVRGRTIFGPEGSEALLSYGKYWRLGANEPTTITFSKDVTIGGNLVPKGRYRMYAIPGESEFVIVLNTEIGAWGYSEPDYSKDLVKINVPVKKEESITEQFTIDINKTDELSILIKWADISLNVPIGR